MTTTHSNHGHDHAHHGHGHHHHGHQQNGSQHHGPHQMQAAPLNRVAFQATLHCMAGCAIGEVAGMVIGTSLGMGMWQTVALAVTLAFITGFGLTMRPLLKGGIPFRQALGIAFAADFISVTVMEIVDNAVMMLIPGAMHAGPTTLFFWVSMAIALAIAVVVAFPVNRWLIMRGKGHAVVHAHHGHH
ncbi:MAG TPA: DUF4396 domain-containing protein [Azospirillaceae bacterium]|nr:DUF4396 domain-containing protein [Azospirillaceae bacterium]